MKATVFTWEYPPNIYGGAGVHAKYITASLAKLVDVEVRTIEEGPPPDIPGVRVRRYRPTLRGLGSPDPRVAKALEIFSFNANMVADPIDADVVHTHTWYVGLGGMLVQAIHDVPLVVTLHSMEPLRPWKADQLGTGYAVSSWAERLAVERAERVIAVSAQMRGDILAHFRVDPDRVVVIHNGVDAEAFRRTERREALARHGVREPYVLFVGRISEQKGIFPLLEAARGLPEDVSLVLCASSPDTPELLARLEAAVAGRPRVRWINAMLPVPEVVELYSHAAVFVCPSIYEPFGLINLEAMACGTPVVASRVGGIPEVVVDGETGWLVPPGDEAALAQALRDALGDPARARRMGEAGRRRVEAHFSWDRIADRTLAVYRDAIAAKAAARGGSAGSGHREGSAR